MTIPPTPEAVHPDVIVIASSIEDIDALAKLIHQLPPTLPIPVVVQISGLWRRSINLPLKNLLDRNSQVQVAYAQKQEKLLAGCVYLIPDDDEFAFLALGVLGLSKKTGISSADHLFQSAAHWYGPCVIGVVLSGLGVNGTEGLRAITKVNGKRMIQNPHEADFPSMPMLALLNDHVQYIVDINESGDLLVKLSADLQSAAPIPNLVHTGEILQAISAYASSMPLLNHSIDAILRIVREELMTDITFVSQKEGNKFIVSHATADPDFAQLQGASYPNEQSICQRVLDGRLPAVMPDVATLRLTHDIPVFPVAVGAYMAALIHLQDGSLFGLLCCLNSSASPDLDQRKYQRLQFAANHIAGIVDH